MGQFLKWSRDDYEADKSRVRSTTLKLMIKAPQGPRAYYRAIHPLELILTEDEQKKEDTKKRNLIVGTLLHELLLEQKQNWFVTEARRNSKQWLDEADEYGAERLLKPREEREIFAMRDAVMRNKQCAAILKAGGMTEQTVVWDVEVGGIIIQCKARLDFLTDSGIIIDLKSSMAVDRDKFHEQIMSYGYEFSAWFYAMGLLSVPEFSDHQVRFLHLVANKHGWAYLWPLSPTWLRVGQEQVKRALADLAECLNREQAGMSPEEAWIDRQESSQLTLLEPKAWYVGQSNYNSGRPLGLDEHGEE